MSWTAKATTGGDFQNPEPVPSNAICVRIIDRGTDPNSKSQFGPKRKLMISFEIDQTMDDGRPFIVNKFLNILDHYGEKSGLRVFFESWRGQKYADDEDIDIGAALGAAALLSLVASQDGQYVNIDSISRLPKSMKPLTPKNPLLAFNLDEPDWDAFNELHEKAQETIMRTPEYKAAMGGDTKAGHPTNAGPASMSGPTSPPGTQAVEAMPADFDDSIPFLSYQKGWIV